MNYLLPVTEAECIQIPCKECKPEEEIKPKPVICIKSSQDGLHGLPGMKQMAKCGKYTIQNKLNQTEKVIF